ncbi:hypothetical protein PTSG_05024 [Salpingoeca rosetta]|uniref:UspA domain-containing protein n=1 Tax=Salpingoeca rosetta (strain ATCC 50818 / BSB-021) TaxID=946362 RepID=F2U9A5_SALR5|nr:uncharacterized protein PTSG_05024 [Salpingoeca rosetta]EGD73308.1 hypothetical protein PTSG_05024 [Salpingoeca rosetta]|eukprot:XP_004994339.1 hypothetical protein PTSG_05024 [Salpingoeca rosetta]
MGKAIVVGADISDQSHEALKWTLANMYQDGDIIHLVHCFRPLQPAVGPHYSYVPTEEEQANWRRQQAKVLEENMVEAKKLKADVHYKSVLIAGDPRDEIIAYGEKEGAVAIVVGNRGRGALKRAFLGSVSSYLVHHSQNIPVVVVHCKHEEESK